jgi:DNA-binding CsgD family transcriptional regulator/tetratricopeptide (TPR) repeat protein
MSAGESEGPSRSAELGLSEAPARVLYGRKSELGVLAGLVDGVPNRGAALLVRGEPGIGKSALLAAASAQATDHGMQVLSAVGVQSEARLPFGGLHQLLRPILGLAEGLHARQRAALLAVFGMSDEVAPELFLIGLATLELIGDTAASSPVLVILEDAQWLDDPSCAALAFVARRLEAEPTVMVIAIRDGYESPFDDAGLPELRLQGLDRTAAGELLDAHAPGLEPVLLERLLAEAAGNPLALVELPAGLQLEDLSAGALLPSPLPLTARLEGAFAAQASELPSATQTLLLVAAADDGGALDEVLSATAIVEGAEVSLDAVAPAVAAQLVEIEGTGLRFRHPLVRSSIYQAAKVSQRQAAHAALTEVLVGQPDRHVWHRAAATLGPDEGVAAELDEAADRAGRSGAVAVAITALERAAELSERPALRGSRLVRAAELALELGRPELAVRLAETAEPLELAADDSMRLSWLRDTLDTGGLWPGPQKVRSFVESAERMRVDGRADLALKSLLTIALTCYWANPDDGTRELVVTEAERLAVPDDSPELTTILALVAPVQRATIVLERIRRFPLEAGGDSAAMLLIGEAASAVGEFERSTACLSAAASELRAQGRLGLLTQALGVYAFNAFYLGSWQQGCTAADEAERLARETRLGLWSTAADLARATLDAVRGNEELAEALVAKAEAVLVPLGFMPMLALVQQARGIVDLAGGRHADAYTQLRRIFDPLDVAYHPFIRCWLIGELAEAAAHSGQQPEARVLLDELEGLATDTGFPYLQAALAYARPLLADDDEAETLFQDGLAINLAPWPFLRARLLLAYGAWLRRRRRVAESRLPLRAAREAFDALGAIPWGDRARQELRASGVTSRRRIPETRDQLTPQELQIASLAAEGLSNREIGQQLYISHRTVAYHLRRIFPKLDITSRTQLHAAVLSLTDATG